MKKIGVIWLLMAAIGGCSEPQRDYGKAAPPEVSTVLEMGGLWVDLEAAVELAATEAGMAVVSVDRWRTLVRFELVTDSGQAGELMVVGVRAEDSGMEGREGLVAGIERGEARIGRFRDGAREALLLSALKDYLAELGADPHLPALDSAEVGDDEDENGG